MRLIALTLTAALAASLALAPAHCRALAKVWRAG